MRILILLALGCSGGPLSSIGAFDDASTDTLIAALSAPALPAPTLTAPTISLEVTTLPRLTEAVAVEELTSRLENVENVGTEWMWAATILPDGADEALELALPPQYGLARATRLARVTVFQSVGVDVARDGGALSPAAPVIAGRALRVRAYLEDGAGSLVLGRLRWVSGGATTLFVGSMQVEGRSEDADPGSLFEFVVPKELVTEDAVFAVDILEDGGVGFDDPSTARFPMGGDAHPLAAEPAMRIEVRLVPMRYTFDGSMRVPNIGAGEVAALREHIEAAFPVSEASITVLPARDYAARVGPDDFDEHVDALHEVIAWRVSDAPPSPVYYVGLVAPEDSFGEYCAGGCYAGIAPLNETNSPFQRASVVVWYGATRSGWTALHELGHTQGRAHVACGGVSGADPEYPYADGVVGVWGFDQRSGTFLSPTRHDFMSYCGDEWVSDYTYAAMAERVRALRSTPSIALASHQRRDLSRRLITTGNRVRWSNMSLPPGVVGDPTKVVAIDTRGRRRMVPAERIQYSIDGPVSFAVRVESDITAYIVDGTRLVVPRVIRSF